jgi:hypothetical protein
MRPIHDKDSEEGRAEAAASLELNRIALRLIAAARHGDLSDFDEEGRATIEVPAGEDDRRVHATLRADGVVLRDGASGPNRSWIVRPGEMSPEELEERRRRKLATEARLGKPKFEGVGYRRTVIAPPQPGVAVRVLAVEIFEDGFYVDFTYDVEVPSPEDLDRGRPPRRPKPPMKIEDDAGTDYYEGERANLGGAPAAFAAFNFSPTPPADATVLRITTESGTVELDLTN